MNTIYIMWLRQMKRFLRSRSRIVGALGQPILWLVVFGFGFSSIYSAAGQGNYIQFLAPGVICMNIIFTAMFSGMEVIWDRQFGFLKETLVAPVSRVALMLGRTFGGATVATLQGLIVLVITLFAGFRPDSWILIVPTVVVMFLIATLFTALGTAFASKLRDFQGFQLIMNFLVMPLFFLSGSIFPLTTAPAALRTVAYFDPLSYGVDAMRALLIGSSAFGLPLDVGVLAAVAAIFLGLGTYFFSKIEI